MRRRKIVEKEITVGTRLELGSVNEFDKLCMKLRVKRADLIRYLIEALIANPEAIEKVQLLEAEKKKRLIRYRASTS